MKKMETKKKHARNGKNLKPLSKTIPQPFGGKSDDEMDRFRDGAAAPLGSPVSLGRQISDMTWEKASKLASVEKHLWW
jgi:hypothetical protein